MIKKYWLPAFIAIFVLSLAACEPKDKGFVRVDKNNRYFVFDDVTPYIPIGFNHFVLYRKTEREIDSLLQLYADHGVNYLRIWVGVSADPEIEVGVFDEERLAKIDYIVKKCRENNIYLTICFWNENNLRPDVGFGWDSAKNVYNKTFFPKGTTDSANDLKGVEHKASWEAMKNRYSIFVNRWKHSRAVFMWDLVNDGKKTAEWKEQMYAYVDSLDENDHIIGFQYNTGVDPKGEMDCGSVRVYDYNPAGNDAEMMAQALFSRVLQALSHGDPVYCGEGGMDHINGAAYDLERGFLHMLWGPIAVGAAGNLHSWLSGKKWPELTLQELKWLKNYSDFCHTIDWANFNSKNLNEKLSASDTTVRVYACGDDNEMLIYLMNDDPENEFNPVKVKLNFSPGMVKSPASINWIDIRTGKTLVETYIKDPDQGVDVPEFRDGMFGYLRM
ncbi:MAG TPA: hypothetical protein VI583_01510 [Cyclobacteriaceae bacterium]|nr:hypothetical protein [Cyclobacteriaceae bacterium]